MENINTQFSLCGKNIIITGASSGIGKQIAISCSQMGANIILIGRNESRLRETISLLSEGNHHYYAQDLTEFQKIESLIIDSLARLGKIDGFVHSAGIELTLPLSGSNPQDYEKLFSVNYISAMEFIKQISKKKYYNSETGASIVLLASIMAVVGNSALVAYSASKGAVLSSVKSLAVELSAKNIRVNAISPGIIETEMIKNLYDSLGSEQITNLKSKYLLGFGKPSDVANGCIYLLSNASRWITGSNLIIDGGYSAI